MKKFFLRKNLGLVVSFLLIFQISLQAQKVKPHLNKGIKYFQSGEYENAADELEKVLKIERKNNTARYYLGLSELNLKNSKEALAHLKMVAPDSFKEYHYNLAKAYLYNAMFDEASESISIQIASKKMVKESEVLAEAIRNGKSMYAQPKPNTIENLGKSINSEFPEYSAILTEDHRTIMFTKKHTDNKGGTQNGEMMEDILVSSMDENDAWSTPERLKGLVTVGHDATVQLFGEDSKMLIYKNGDLLITEKVGEKWSSPKSIGSNINGKNSKESHGFISKDGKTLIFSSNAKSKNGNMDLFISRRSSNSGSWGTPKLLYELNTDEDEESPFIAEDGTLYFSSRGHDAIGGYDIFSAEYDSFKKTYINPKNLGYPINSVSNDIFFNLKNDIAYFTSDRVGGHGTEDIYRAYMFEKTILAGKIFDQISLDPLQGCKIVLEADGMDYFYTTNAAGEYKVEIPFDKTFHLKILRDDKVVFEEEYKPVISLKDPRNVNRDFFVEIEKEKEVFASKKPGQDLVKKSGNTAAKPKITNQTGKTLPKFKVGQKMIARIYFDPAKATITSESYDELNSIVKLFKDNPNLKIEISGHTDNVGDPNYNLNLSQRRAQAVVNYLVSKDIDASRLTAKGYGETKPLASNDDEKDGREINRRIEMKVLNN
ncbi:OmpA family protein [Flexithrix dorotheae]|uniref:OmpA family protein n=1 Tax=Flexithrix dorotheae TaxID=70993 RepID=UPI0012F9D3BE|nr:OmpA family protein [Flexithrix dorotheae]